MIVGAAGRDIERNGGMDRSVIDIVRDLRRLTALARLDVLDTAADEAFDRITRLASRACNAPVALASFVDRERQFFKSATGLAEPWASRREMPLSFSFCQYVVATAKPLVVADARQDERLKDSPAVRELGVIAYAGAPLTTADGQQVGSFCVLDYEPHQWNGDDLELLRVLGSSVMTALELRASMREAEVARERARTAEQRLKELVGSLQNALARMQSSV